MKPSPFITFEGIDGCGKTTQVRLLSEWLQKRGHATLLLRDPGGTPIGEAVRSILLDTAHSEMDAVTELLLYAASRSQLVSELIKPALSSGTIVISDRFYDSTSAYQGFGRVLPGELIMNLNAVGSHGLTPDLTVFLDIDPEAGLQRVDSNRERDRMESGGNSFITRVREGFLTLAAREPERFLVLDASRSINDLHEQIINTIKNRFSEL